ncbi:hypothetical protein ACH5RR_028787 [Cinchona calisaya]|uniref:Pentatricopeptide repeat-containing protein n=1 Tax=Cinchona calisaya TaxID=153742 RepID=A0ABD2YR75_9GENT
MITKYYLVRIFTSSSSNPLLTKLKYSSVHRNLGGFSFFFSTATTPSTASPAITSDSLPKDSDSLFSRLINHKDTIPQILRKWVDEGRAVDVDNVRIIIKHFRNYKRFRHALQVSEWMDNIHDSKLRVGDAAVHLDLISKVRGMEQAEKYLESLPDNLRVFQTYGALLNSYAQAKSLDKAEAIMHKMRQLHYNKTLCYNVMLNLYSQMGKQEKLESLVQEMDDKGIYFDQFSYNIRLNAYIAASDIRGMEKLLMKMEADPLVVMNWNSYSTAANGFLKASDIEKAEMLLKKSEELIKSATVGAKVGPKARVKAVERASQAYEVLITLYASMGRKGEVYRLWNLHKKPRKFYNRSYACIISSLLKLDDLGGAEKILDEWFSNKIYFDIRIPNLLVTAFCKEGNTEKAESIISRLVESGNEPNASTWSHMASGYYKNNQMENAVEMTKKSIATSFPGWRPDFPVLAACLEYLREKGDVDGAEETIRLLEQRGKFSADIRDRISRYIRKGDPASTALDQMELKSET